MAQTQLDFSIVIVNYNTAKLTIACIDSIIKNTKNKSYEIILVDNDSESIDRQTLVRAVKQNKRVRLILSDRNVGFAGGNNIGIRASIGQYVLLINSDTVIKTSAISEMVDWMAENPTVGIATCELRNNDGSIQGSGGYFPTLFRVYAWMLFIDDLPLLDKAIKPYHPLHAKSLYRGETNFSKQHEQDWVTGAFFLIRRQVIEEIGLLDEDYFMYVEDMAYCYKAKQKGWQIMYVPASHIIHLGGSSSAKEYPILAELKALRLFYKKHMPKWQLPFLTVAFKLGCVARMIILGILEGKNTFETYAKIYKQI